MSRRERLQLANKERARNERRARAKQRRIDLEEEEEAAGGSVQAAKPRGEAVLIFIQSLQMRIQATGNLADSSLKKMAKNH